MGVDARAMALFSRLAPAQVKDRVTRLLLDL
jgi:hypothetical protein